MMKTSASMEEEILRRVMLMRSGRFEKYREYGVDYPKFEEVLPMFRALLGGSDGLAVLDAQDLMEQFVDHIERSICEKVDHLDRTEFRFIPAEGSA